MGEVGTVTRDETITVKIATPHVVPRARKRPTPPFERTVVRMRREQA